MLNGNPIYFTGNMTNIQRLAEIQTIGHGKCQRATPVSVALPKIAGS